MANALFSVRFDVRLWRYTRVLLIFSLLIFSGSALAECDINPPAGFNVSQTCSTREVAHEACSNQAAAQMAAWGGSVSCGFYGGVETQYRLLTAGGGLSNYAAHAWENECNSGEIWNDATKQCEIPPDCTAGEQKTLTEFQATGETVFYIGGGGPDLVDAGCRYTCSSSGSTGAYFYDDTGTYREYLCTATGEASQATDTAAATVPATAKSSEGSTNSNGQSCSTVGGTTVCVGGDLADNCMTVNGVKSCQSEAAADEAVIDDQPVSKNDDKNCVKASNGEIICVADASESEFCGTVNGVKTCYSRTGAKETTTTMTETLADGTVVQTQSTGSNVRNNVNEGVVTQTTAPDGTVTTVREGGDQGALQDIAKAAGKAECDKPGMSGTVACMDADELKGEAGTPGAVGEGSESGKWYTATEKTFQSVLEGSMSQIQNQPIMQFGNDLFAVTIPAGSCPSWTIDGSAAGIAPITVAPLCSDMMENFWPMISGVVQVLAVFMAFYIAMRGL